MKITNSAYIRFLNYLEAVGPAEIKSPNAVEEQLLDYIAIAHSQGQQLLVGDLIKLSQYGSQATLHGRLKRLTAMGYIKLSEDREDGRKKVVTPTVKTIKHYEKLSTFLEKAAKPGQ